jgi:hypothetical protein
MRTPGSSGRPRRRRGRAGRRLRGGGHWRRRRRGRRRDGGGRSRGVERPRTTDGRSARTEQQRPRCECRDQACACPHSVPPWPSTSCPCKTSCRLRGFTVPDLRTPRVRAPHRTLRSATPVCADSRLEQIVTIADGPVGPRRAQAWCVFCARRRTSVELVRSGDDRSRRGAGRADGRAARWARRSRRGDDPPTAREPVPRPRRPPARARRRSAPTHGDGPAERPSR